MSGFDFGSLRDPDAPEPDSHHREGVEMRARELMTRARRWRMLASGLAFVAVAATVVGVVATRESSPPKISVTNHSSTTVAPTSTTSTPTTKPGVVATTTTTTTPRVPLHSVVSATFVSTSRGWALDKNGNVLGTTDGGRSWHSVGSLGRSDMTIRFGDASHGFAFPSQDTNTPTNLVTVDGGATWKALNAPFSGRAYDLAISKGTVYAVAFDSNANFRIWSSPAGNLSWTEDPIKVPVGGGPVPSIQLVFSNGAGWLMEVDRVVVGGAQMSTTVHWSKWTPPCSTANGPATLAAWSATDLIASCDEGVWGSPPAPAKAVYTSHDAGATFQRRSAPVFGAVAAADPNYALLATGDTIRRSVDGGRTWTTVAGSAVSNPGDSQPLDLGFTSNTQGFVIFANDQMVMTYDAGATWSAMTQP